MVYIYIIYNIPKQHFLVLGLSGHSLIFACQNYEIDRGWGDGGGTRRTFADHIKLIR